MQTQTQSNLAQRTLAKTGGFLKKAYHLALCDENGDVSVAKCLVTVAAIAYIALVNPWLLLAGLELLVIFSVLWFIFKLALGKDPVTENGTATS